MTWPPPPPSSDPWATEPDPVGDMPSPEREPEPDAEPEATEALEPAPQPEPEPEPEPTFEPEPEPEHHDPAPPIDAGYTAEPEIFAPSAPSAPPPPSAPLPPEPVPEAGGWAPYSHTPPPVVPRPQAPPPPSKKPIWLAAAAVAAVVVIGLVVWLVVPSGDDDSAQTADTSTSTTPTADAQAESRLLGMLPAGYAADGCEAVAPPSGARASATCGPNTDPGGPASSTYTITEDGPALDAAFNAVVNRSTQVNCPGNIQSPGPWRRNATPQKVSGVLFCGIRQNRPVVAWTDVDESLVAVAESGPQGPNLDQLYLWWSSHS